MTAAPFDVVKDLIGRGPVFAGADAELIRTVYEKLLDDGPVTLDSVSGDATRGARGTPSSCRSDVVGNFCNVVYLFVSRDAAERWIGAREDIIILSPEEGFALGTVIVDQRAGRSPANKAEA